MSVKRLRVVEVYTNIIKIAQEATFGLTLANTFNSNFQNKYVSTQYQPPCPSKMNERLTCNREDSIESGKT